MLQRRCNIVHTQGDVVQPRSALLDVLRNWRIWRRPLEQFQLGLAGGNEMRTDALRGDVLRAFDFETKRVTIEGDGSREIAHRNSHVIQYCSHIKVCSSVI